MKRTCTWLGSLTILLATVVTVYAIEDTTWGRLKTSWNDTKPTVAAKVLVTEVSATMQVVGVDFGEVINNNGGVLISRDLQIDLVVVSGDLVGTATAFQTGSNSNLKTGKGTLFTPFVLNVTSVALGKTGVFTGRISAEVVGPVETDHLVGHGSGEFAGMLIKGTVIGNQATGVFEFDGYIQDPHGQ